MNDQPTVALKVGAHVPTPREELLFAAQAARQFPLPKGATNLPRRRAIVDPDGRISVSDRDSWLAFRGQPTPRAIQLTNEAVVASLVAVFLRRGFHAHMALTRALCRLIS
jgi:hypothetical protein